MSAGLFLMAAWGAESLAAGALTVLRTQPLAIAVIVHGVAALLAARAFGGERADDRFASFSLVLALPLLGLLGLSLMRLATWLMPPSGLYRSVHSAMVELPGPERPPESLDRVFEWLQTQLSVQPLADVIRGGDAKMRRWAIELLGRRADGAAVELLREALQSEDRDTQIAASAALQRVEERLTSQINRAEERARREPASAEAWSALGEACCAYRASRLLEAVMERHWLVRAEEAYRRVLAREPGAAAMLGLARVLSGLGRLDEAEALVRQLQMRRPSPEGDLFLSEVLFAQGRWSELRAACQAAVAAGRRDELLVWWATPADAPPSLETPPR